MKPKVVAVGALAFLLLGNGAWAHRIDEYLQATIFSLEVNRVRASMRLIPGVLVASSVIAVIDSNRDGIFSETETRAYALRVLEDLSITVDGHTAQAQLDAWSVPDPSQLRDGLGEISIQYHVDLPREGEASRSLTVANHHLHARSVYLMNVEVPQDPELHIVDQKRNERQSVYELDYRQVHDANISSGLRAGLQGWLKGLQFSNLFRLGMRHIAEGTDHLLFLLVLLLPAPLRAVGSRWGRPVDSRQSLLAIAGIVTAFTVGHSLTLTLAAMNFVHVPSRPVEVLIAASILVSAMHALRPIFPGREAWIAAFFGLIHGLAFAATLDRLGLSRWHRVIGIIAFNLGIETMQLLVIAAVLPSLLLLSRTNLYSALRIAAASAAGAASIAWISERLLHVQTPVDAAVNVILQRGVLCASILFAISLACMFFDRRSRYTITPVARAASLEHD